MKTFDEVMEQFKVENKEQLIENLKNSYTNNKTFVETIHGIALPFLVTLTLEILTIGANEKSFDYATAFTCAQLHKVFSWGVLVGQRMNEHDIEKIFAESGHSPK